MRRALGAVAVVALGLATTRPQAQPAAWFGFDGGRTPLAVGPTPAGLRGVGPDDCGECHAEIADEWRRSQHATAWVDPVFEVAFAREPGDDCRNCHGPRAEARSEGVSCAVCHVRDGRVVGARGGASHPMTTAAALAGVTACGGCHQFNFPPPAGWTGGALPSQPMQDTVREWREGGAAESCQHCHMPRVGEGRATAHASHRFAGWSDPALLRRSVEVSVTASRSGDALVVEVALVAMRGHAVPTGDQFRALELSAWPAGEPRRAHRDALGRTFHPVTVSDAQGRSAVVRREATDTRLRPGERRTFSYRWPGARGPARWSLEHVRVPDDQPWPRGVPPSGRRTLIASGEVAVRPTPRP